MASCGVLSPAVRWERYYTGHGSVFEQDPVVGGERCHFKLRGSNAIFRVHVAQHGAATEAEAIVNCSTIAQLGTKGHPSTKLFECTA